ncbi:GntR family transcriptional regulator [Plantibacter sp. YIM 135249]|uniref:GntR family transcriptional regulator n=1 Tax=Plantibacter sp. YIM 135249 TaxID=3423918 RepID=UPI003D342CF9
MPVPEVVEPCMRTSSRTMAAERLRAAIFDGTFEPGERLRDSELSHWLGVSRTPLREALHDLGQVGLVERCPQRHTRVVEAEPGRKTVLAEALEGVMVLLLTSSPAPWPSTTVTELSKQVRLAGQAVRSMDVRGHNRAFRELLAGLSHSGTNPVLSSVLSPHVPVLAHRVCIAWESPAAGPVVERRSLLMQAYQELSVRVSSQSTEAIIEGTATLIHAFRG